MIVVLRASLTFLILMILFRSAGNKQIPHFTFKDYVLGMCLGSVAGRAITKLEEPYIYFVGGFITLELMNLLLSHLTLKNETIRILANGEPIILVYNGQILNNNLKKAKMSLDGLTSLLREKSIFNICDVEYIVLEPHGGFSVLLKSESSPLTPKDMGICLNPKELPVLVIKEGKVVTAELKKYGLTDEWIRDQLLQHNIMDISQVLLAQANRSGFTYICNYDSLECED
jgi:uncharacterized membrane protein YcaP (DUF421 family)